jgi:hypothetical protein
LLAPSTFDFWYIFKLPLLNPSARSMSNRFLFASLFLILSSMVVAMLITSSFKDTAQS